MDASPLHKEIAVAAKQVLEPDPDRRHAGMSQGIRVGNTIHVSGQVALDSSGVVGVGDAAAQAEQAFANLASVLAVGGAGLDDVVKLVCYLVDTEHFAGYAEVKNRIYPGEAPASTTVVISELLIPELLLEIDAVAVVE